MPRAYHLSDDAEPGRDPNAGEWQALRGELVALLDKVESRYTEAEPEPAMTGLARRVRNLRDQVDGTENASRRREALKTVKRAVDRFSERDREPEDPVRDDLTAAINEIRSRQGAQPHPMRRATDNSELRELGTLVGGISDRLERLERELRAQRSNSGQVREVAGQVEQLAQVVELLAGAVGETGQVKRLEAQIAALGDMIEDAPKVDLVAVNARLDDVAATVGKLAELQAQQMEREIVRDNRQSAGTEMAQIVPAVDAIETSVRSVYDRIDAIERSVALSAGDFERLTSEMAAFTQAMRDKDKAPNALVARVEALAERLEGMDSTNGEVAALKIDLAGLRDAVLTGMEPRFLRLENQIEALNERVVPVDTGAVESQLKALMARMDDAGAQLDGLARLYQADERPDLESLATMVAERTSEAMSRKAPAPVAMFGPDSLKSIEDRLTGLIKSAGKSPDYDTLADLIVARTNAAVGRQVPGADAEKIDALEKRMSALLNTAGRETAERLARLEAVLTARSEQASAPAAEAISPVPAPSSKAVVPKTDAGHERIDAFLADLSRGGPDAMPASPAEERPLIDHAGRPEPRRPGAKPQAPGAAMASETVAPVAPAQHRLDPSQVQKPPRPRSSFATDDGDPFAEQMPKVEAPEPVTATSSTSTFVAAARRAQRAKQEQPQASAESNSLIGRALARVRSKKSEEKTEAVQAVKAAVLPVPATEPAPARLSRKERKEKAKAEKAQNAARAALPEQADAEAGPSFLTRHRRPILLAATLVAVSMLALNLVLQRSNEATPPAEAEPAPQVEQSIEEMPAVEAEPALQQSSIVPPRVIDMVDPTATGSINPGAPMTFSRATAMSPGAATTAETPVVPVSAALPAELEIMPEATVTSEPELAAAAQPATETFELPAEGVGPQELREAAAAGNAQAQFEVAAILGEGRVMDKNPEESAKWYERSAAQGFVPAQYRLGNLYEMGTGVEQDFEQARLWYQRGAEAGNRMAMHNLAALYAGGQLGEQDFDLAAGWFQKAAAQGMTDSQFNLGMLYARGLGVEQSFEQSYKWFSLAALSGDKDAGQAKDDIAKSLTADAVKRIDGEVEAWTIAPVDFAANFAPMGTWSSAFDPGDAINGSDVIAKVQLALGKLGFDVGTPDGVAGPKTAEAIKSFERATGMSEIGDINPRLLAVLGSQPV